MHEREIFAAVLEKPTEADRQAFLDEVCAGDPALRERLQRLLTERANLGSFLNHPAVASVATQILSDTANAANHELSGSRTIPECDDVPLDFLAPAQEPGSLGRLGQYEILAPVGRGGMGIVLKARDTRLHRIVAVKVLAPELASNPTARKRFLREAQAAAAVSHDHVVTIHAVDENNVAGLAERAGQSGLPYLVMEFIDGQSLQQKLDKQGALPLPEILRIGRQIAAGLAAAHAQGLIHRDVKPSNILLQNGVERVQITDFGLARAVDDVSMTRTGEVTGTPQYMSPEQAQGLPVDARSDLFCLGSVLYAMCTGRSPFRADSTMAALRRVCDDTPRPIREINPDIPDWLAAIIDRLLQKNPDDRFQTAGEVAELLEKCLAHVQDPRSARPRLGLPAPREPGIRRTARRLWSPRWVTAAMVVGLAVAGLSVTEATGVTKLSATVVRIVTGEGTLVIEVDDPTVEVSLDGEELTISGAGLQEVRLRPGQYQFQATKDGSPVQQELVTIHRGDRQVVRVTRNGAAPPPVVVGGVAERGAFVRLGHPGVAELDFDTLAEAVLGASAGDTIEIRGNGPFVTQPIVVSHPLTIRAANGFRPVITDDPQRTQQSGDESLLLVESPLVLEGLDLQTRTGYEHLLQAVAPVSATNCRFLNSDGLEAIWTTTSVTLRNCMIVVADSASIGLWGNTASRDAHIRNCILVGHVNIDDFGKDRDSSLVLQSNTVMCPAQECSLLLVTRYAAAPRAATPPFEIHAANNVFDPTTTLLNFQEAAEPDGANDATELEALLTSRIDWREERNLYRAGRPYLHVFRDRQPNVASDRNLAGWNEFWGLTEPRSEEGVIHYQGGDLHAKALAVSEQLTPDDFRLRADSAGYQSGPEGKDLGADIDLIGPGDAYERWKQAPEYATWLKEAARLMSGATSSTAVTEPGAFVVLGSENIAEQKFDTLAEAVLGSSAGDTIEIHGHRPFVSDAINIVHPLTIRAGVGDQPVLIQSAETRQHAFIAVHATLVLEGLELQRPVQCGVGSVLGTTEHGPPALFISNCRLVSNLDQGGLLIWHRALQAEIRNSVLIGGDIAVDWNSRSGGSQVIKNCVVSGALGISYGGCGETDFDLHDVSIAFRGNTVTGTPYGDIGVAFNSIPTIPEGVASIDVEVERNIFTGNGPLHRVQYFPFLDQGETVSNLLTAVQRLTTWQARQNLCPPDADFLEIQLSTAPENLNPTGSEIFSRRLEPTAADDPTFWGVTEAGYQRGVIRFSGGDLSARRQHALNALPLEDFRLRPESAGYLAGTDGKDLGADVEIVGPGAPYERWKQSPEYATWLEEVARLMSSSPAEAAGAQTGAASDADQGETPDTN